ncbi:double-strand break repair helicase AddA [Roseiterribacter gracilis]|uniref:DNA 3'-5' helicase n=1 Tax=Roseiterribacter gracilis TaxID=2812848 RepID=A0A8S8XDQ5_9PROT|nr:double-strand break repair helicase AddA [Rhodospirillales bacterium TMPK1]
MNSADQDQRYASDPTSSAWVGASAGSGKTKVLTDRVLRLLLDGVDPQRLLCLTFTKAAAAEMSIRVGERLAAWATQDEDKLIASLHALTDKVPDEATRKRARTLFARTVDLPQGPRIQTIHGFCQSVLRRFPLEAGVSPQFRLLDEREAQELLDEARDEVLHGARAEPDSTLGRALAELVRRAGEATFADLISELTASRAKLATFLEREGGVAGAVAQVRATVGVEPDATTESVLRDACADHAFDGTELRSACELLSRGSKTDQERSAKIAAWLADASGRAGSFAAYWRAYLTEKRELRATLATKASAAALPALQQEASRVLGVLDRLNAVGTAEATEALLVVGAALLDEYARRKARSGGLDYEDLIATTGALLARDGVAAWVLFKLDGGIEHVLVDEAQDTNPAQWRIVQALTDEFFVGLGAVDRPRTVFAVGDEKQSIFSFQGADPNEFARMRQHFADRTREIERPLREVPLNVSFRSTEPVLRLVDRVFADDAARKGVAHTPIAHQVTRKGQAGLVELWPLVEETEREAPLPWAPPVETAHEEASASRLAMQIAQKIRRWLDDGTRLESHGRAIRPGDVMILVRRRAPDFVPAMVRALKSLNVPVAGVDRMVLTRELAVMDLLALGRFLLLPDDDLTLATLLKTPLVGLGEDDLFELAHRRGEQSLWSSLHARSRENKTWEAARVWLSRLLGEADLVPPYELFASALLRACPADPLGSGRRAIQARLGAEALDPLEEFLTACLIHSAAHTPSLQSFLAWLEAGEAELKRELAQGTRDEVRLITVHGAKGLQAPIVVLPDTTGTIDKSQGPRLLWADGDVPLWGGARADEDSVARAARRVHEQAADDEYRRLLYVALTRAEDRLIVAGWQKRRAVPAGSWYRLVEAAMQGDDVQRHDDGTAQISIEQRAEPDRTARALREETVAIDPVPDALRVPPAAEPTPTKPLTPSRPTMRDPPARSPAMRSGDQALRKRGRLVHKLLQLLPNLAQEARADACARFLAQPAHALDVDTQASLAREVLAVLADPDFATVFAPGSRAEVPVVGRIGTTLVAGQVDRLAIGDDAIWVVDYKTDRPPPERASDAPPAYLAQLAAYVAVIARLFPVRPVRAALLWTETPRLMELPNQLLNPYLLRLESGAT